MEGDFREMEENRKKQGGIFFAGFGVGILAALLVVTFVYGMSSLVKLMTVYEENPENSMITADVVKKQRVLEETIEEFFYLHEVDRDALVEGIYKGMVESLDDVYSEYYSAEELAMVERELEGSYYGIGCYVSMDKEAQLPIVTGIIEDSPSEQAGLRANDIIYEIDGVSVYGLKLREVVSLIKGEEHTEVKLKLIREGEKDYVELAISRGKVDTPTVHFKMLDDEMAYIQITEFKKITVDQFADALAMAKGSDMKGLILDLRGNPGGSLSAVNDVARMILPEGLILYMETKTGDRREFTCDGNRQLEVPLVVLVDGNSASASEVLAGAIKDHEMGTLVGTTTFGKGIVQDIIPFSDGSAVKLTVSGYYTPDGNNIHEVGIEPDVVCEFDGEAFYRDENPVDNQLEKAKEVLENQIYK